MIEEVFFDAMKSAIWSNYFFAFNLFLSLPRFQRPVTQNFQEDLINFPGPIHYHNMSPTFYNMCWIRIAKWQYSVTRSMNMYVQDRRSFIFPFRNHF